MIAASQAPAHFDGLEAAVDFLLARVGKRIVLGAPLGIGKPHRLLNAIYARVSADPSIQLSINTALSLTPPRAPNALAARFLDPFLERHFGADFPRLAWVDAELADALPPNIEVEEFYLQSGALLKSRPAQRRYASLNYTHVARALADRGMNVLVQKVACEPNGARLSLSCNPDLSFDAVEAVVAAGLPRPLLIAEVDSTLPWIGGTAAVDADWFDAVIDLPGPTPQLFALPRQAVTDAEYAIGLYASAMVRDGGTLQIGIGALSDALCHALILRHTRNADYRVLLEALSPGLAESELVREHGGVGRFDTGLYGASEMVNDGFMRLIEAGVIRRCVVDDIEVMRRLDAGTATTLDHELIEREGQYVHGAFYLGSKALYQWLRELPPNRMRRIGMTRVSHINELYGGNEALERLQRRDARFFNTCMLMNVLGAATSDGLADGRVVSGVGGQYNFVAMAFALRHARSVLMFRASRESAGRVRSNVVFNYPHCTIPRHLRDIAITEYGIADLRGRCDEDCVIAMAAIADVRFVPGLLAESKSALKLRTDFVAPTNWSTHSPAHLSRTLQPFHASGLLPDYPMGSDFTAEEEHLAKALGWLLANTATPVRKLRTVVSAFLHGRSSDLEAMRRMRLDKPHGLGEWIESRLVGFALERTRPS
ncbi:MAG: acetyl-CoA hydrolase/transferase C-terminal domain-containing protein [Dokdonella sp.]